MDHYFGKYIIEHFDRTIMIHWYNLLNIEEYITMFNPDIVVIESAERTLQDFAYYVSLIPELYN